MSGGATPLRAVRIDGPLWEKAQAKAAEQGDNLSDVMRDAVRRYASSERDPLTEILELSQNAKTIDARLSLRDQIQAIAKRIRSSA